MQKKLAHHKQNLRALFLSILIIGIFCTFIALVLGYQLAHRIEHRPFPIPRETNVNLIQSWMTLRYISHTYKVPEEELQKKLSLENIDTSRLSIAKISKQTNQSTDTLITKIKTVIKEFQTSHPRPQIRTFE